MDWEELRRLRHADAVVCAKCIEEPDLETFIRNSDGEPGCSFCNRRDAPTCALGDLIEHIGGCIQGEYDLAANWLPYESREGGWLWDEVWDTPDLITEELGIGLPRDERSVLLNAIVEGLGGLEDWCVSNPYGEDPLEELRAGWDHFTKLVKHQTRFFLDRWKPPPEPPPSLPQDLTPAQILRAIGQRIELMELIRELPTATCIYRARFCKDGKKLATPAELGPPLPEQALLSNRMSPPGIPMLYGAMDGATALAETVKKPGMYAIGVFRSCRPARVLDLGKLPEVPGFFAELPDTQAWTRRDALFFRDLVADFVQPIERDDRTHIDYIPTQVFTEYCRLAFHVEHEEQQPLDGIVYPSSRGTGGASIVLFAVRTSVKGATSDSDAAWIELTDVIYKRSGEPKSRS